MAFQSLYIRVTNLTTATLYINDINQGFDGQGTAQRDRRPGPCYVPASSFVDLTLSSDVLLSYETGSIRKQVDAGHLSVSGVAGGIQTWTWQYDYASDLATVAAHTLKNVQGVAQTVNNVVALRGYVEVITAVLSGGAATVALGITGATTGFLAATGKANFTANAIIPFSGATVANGTADASPVQTRITTAKSVIATIGTAALTAGKFRVHLEVLPIL